MSPDGRRQRFDASLRPLGHGHRRSRPRDAGADAAGPAAAAGPGSPRAAAAPDAASARPDRGGRRGGLAGVIHVAGGGSSQPTAAHLSRASERAVAAAINLRAADLPGFSLEGSSNDVSAGGNPGGQFKSCFGASLPSGSSEPAFGSPGFSEQGSYGYVGVGSQVSFVSAAQLRRDATIARNARFPQCFAQAFAAMTFKAHGVTITGSNPETQTLSTSPPSASGVFPVLAMRASMTWTIRGIPVPVAFDIFLVAVGHDELSFYSFALGRPYSSAAEERLVSLLVTRALAQPH